jgi:hypothetical protein
MVGTWGIIENGGWGDMLEFFLHGNCHGTEPYCHPPE